MTVGDELTNDFRFAHRELEQTGDAIDSATTRTRHAIEGVRDTPHPMLKRRAGVIFPRIAMTAAGKDVVSTQFIDQRDRAGQFRGEGHSLDHVTLLKQWLVDPTSRFSH